MNTVTSPLILACCLTWAAPAQAADPAAVPPERLARHALGRADAATKLSQCLATRAADLKAVADALLAERDAKKQAGLEAGLEGAHRSLTSCLGPLPPATPGGVPGALPRAKVRAVVLEIEPADSAAAWQAGIKAWLERHQAALRACYRPAAARDPQLMGRATYRLTFGPEGRLAGAALLSTSLANMSVAHCAARKLGTLQPAPKLGPGAKVTLRLVFSTRN